ncbi:hypothetical protein L486_03917 [Kwoniella mangroviensis CBS 10435]|uniref:Uncharacterized protein n=1 Tax=Kwoniella mangroviensis CBS 10435 TaxID=1331196 RepID=A0A1B9IQR5_9TREE|nr:hypothetical protein L486_03917 [Kwoniella mangroviensis CBS 10435]
MDIIHKFNPFHRPSSSLRSSHTPTPTPAFSNARPSSSLESDHTYPSIDSTIPPRSYEEGRYLATPDPVPPLSPARKTGHHRTPSILRSLAHHPSLSALKNKSKKKRKARDEVLPPLPSPVLISGNGAEMGMVSERNKLRKNSLKVSRSVPRDLRLSDEYHGQLYIQSLSQWIAFTDSSGSIDGFLEDPIPPLPLLPSTLHNSQTRSASSATSRSRSNSVTPVLNKQMSIRRKPAPSPQLEDILYSNPKFHHSVGMGHDDFHTPESMRVRMQFEIDLSTRSTSFDIDQSPSMSGKRDGLRLGVDSPRRRRYMSFDQRISPENGKIRNLSSPADTPSRPPLANRSYPAPIADRSHLYAQSLYADSTTFFSTDFGAPPSQALDWTEEPIQQDAFDMFVDNGTLPPGTPGGKKEDLQRGVLSDGAKHEKDAVRFFSRDTYPPVSPSNSVSPDTTPSKPPARISPARSIDHRSPAKHRRAESSPACSPIRRFPSKSKESEFSRAAKRSSSPFEVKLSANVTKRMSLDAFGATPITSCFGDDADGNLEEVLEREDEEEAHDHTDRSYRNNDRLQDEGLEGYEAHELSNITESPFSEDHSTTYQISIVDHTPINQHTTTDTSTKFFTPFSPSLSAQGLPLPTSPTSPLPLLRKKYLSAPPLSVTNSLLEAHADHTKALKDQLKAGGFMMDVLKSENEELKTVMKNIRQEEEQQIVDMKSRNAELEVWKENCETINQLRQAMKENEEFFERLQEAHDELADRCAALEEENLLMKVDHDATAKLIHNLKRENEVSQVESQKAKGLKNENDELEMVIFELRREMKWAENQIEVKNKLLVEKDKVIEERGRMIGEKEKVEEELGKMRRELEEKKELLERSQLESQHFSATLTESLSVSSHQVVSMREQLVQKHNIIGHLEDDLKESRNHLTDHQDIIQNQKSQIKEGEMSIHEQEFTISTLREQLDSAQQSVQSFNLFLQEKDEKISSLLAESCSLHDGVKSLKIELVEKEKIISALKEGVEIARFEKNERRFQSEIEIGQLHEQLEELTRSSAEREWAGRQGTEMIARLMEEKRVWEEEKEELIEMINQNSLDEESASNLRDQITNLENQLSSLKYHYESLQSELEETRSSVQHKNTLIHAQEAELETLRLTIQQNEQSLSHTTESFEKQLKDSIRVVERLRERIEELEIQLESRERALKELILKNENVKQTEEGINSSLKAFINEIDQLKLSETKLRNELHEVRKASSADIFNMEELRKKVKGLEEDKELLNIALQSKELELALSNRTAAHSKKTVPSTPSTSSTIRGIGAGSSSVRNSMSYSTSRIPNTPTPSTGMDNTPLPRRLATSTSATPSSAAALNRSRRETISHSSTTNTTNPTGSALNRSRRDTIASAGRVALGNSTKHNTPSPSEQANNTQSKPSSSIQSGLSTTAGSTMKKVERRTSLPVLVRRPSSVMSSTFKRESLSRVDEV